jgi:hypothetical protein
MKLLRSAFQFILLKGSFINDHLYQSYIKQTSQLIQHPITIQESNLFQRNKYDNDTILIGHSFGGYLALLDYLHNRDKIKGIILINSHFNYPKKAIYPSINPLKITIPVLTILGGQDDKLPLDISYWETQKKVELDLKDKYYYIYPSMDHLNGFLDNNYTKYNSMLSSIFINNIIEQNMTQIQTICQFYQKKYQWEPCSFINDKINFSNSFHFIDLLFKIIWGDNLWNQIHFLLFLYFKPIDTNGIFISDNSIFIKSKDLDIYQLIENYKSLHPILSNYQPKIIKLPSFYPYSMTKWLHSTPSILQNQTFEVFQIPFWKEINYYKFPNPNLIIIDSIKNSI